MSFFLNQGSNQKKQPQPNEQQFQYQGSYSSSTSNVNYPDLNELTKEISESGWGGESKEGNTAFRQQICGNLVMPITSGWGPQNQNQNQSNNNPYQLWNQAQKNITHQNINNNQGFQPNFQQQQQQSILYQFSQFTMNEIFERPIRQCKYPSPYIKYKIIPILDEKKALDVASVNNDKKKLKKNNIIIWDYHGGPNQQFYINEQHDGSGKFFIINVAKGFTLEVPNFSEMDGEQMYANPRNNSPNQLWELKPVGDGSFTIQSFNGKLLDLFETSTKNGTPVIQWPSNDGKNQRWRIVPV